MRHVLLAALCLSLVGCHKKAPTPPTQQAAAPTAKPAPTQKAPETKKESVAPAPASSAMLRSEFERLVVSKTQAQVLKAVGRPDKTYYRGDDMIWEYHQRTKDELSQKVDEVAILTFLETRNAGVGRDTVSRVNYR